MTANSAASSHRFGAWLPTRRVQGRSLLSAYRKQAAQAGQPNKSLELTPLEVAVVIEGGGEGRRPVSSKT